ncbi:hypothetical protein BDA99DRAFT_534120 [Phascolomyces articulosus]|uniref:Uncharacterized protein n=1 Tax=Phascolomyces articulosus TaxID=60185 RepID=A0AAD5PH02_9FUNG|nr:hypothetical protein BDA99DRAFT_534120 [Phascolomyces articulosus]
MMSYKRNPNDWNNSRTSHGRATTTTINSGYSSNHASVFSYTMDDPNVMTNNTPTTTTTNNNTTPTTRIMETTPTTTEPANNFTYTPQSLTTLQNSMTQQQAHSRRHHYSNHSYHVQRYNQQDTNPLALLRQQQELEESKQWYNLPMEEKLKRMPNPPVCFCGKPAYSHDTDLGMMYDCHGFENKDTKRICGFHVHARAWDQFRQQLVKGQDVDQHDPELSICPFFNFTFCVIFFYINDYPKRFPPTPKCFCNLQVIIHEVEEKRSVDNEYWKRLEFKCPHHHIDGAKPKCTWTCKANQVAFGRPKRLIHSKEIDDYVARIRARQHQQQRDDDEEEEEETEDQHPSVTITTMTLSSTSDTSVTTTPVVMNSPSASTSTSLSSIVSSSSTPHLTSTSTIENKSHSSIVLEDEKDG